MGTVDVRDAETHLSELLTRVEGGEEIVITRAGHPVARLIPLRPGTPRHFGGTPMTILDGFDASISETELTCGSDAAAPPGRHGAEVLAVTLEHALLAGSLVWTHRDPFDRLLVAQATMRTRLSSRSTRPSSTFRCPAS